MIKNIVFYQYNKFDLVKTVIFLSAFFIALRKIVLNSESFSEFKAIKGIVTGLENSLHGLILMKRKLTIISHQF